MSTTKPRWRRVYRLGKCQDCGHVKRTTVCIFWCTGYRFRFCASCLNYYRDRILRNHVEQREITP
jgi:hypothetical protein